MEMFDKFVTDERAMKDPLDGVVTIAIALVLIATLGVAAFNLVGNANYSYNATNNNGFDPTTKTIVQTVLAIIGAIVLVIILIGVAKKYR